MAVSGCQDAAKELALLINRIVLTAGILISFACTGSAAETDSGAWLPIKRQDIIQLLSKDVDESSVKVQTFENVLNDARLKSVSDPKMINQLRNLEARQSELVKALEPNERVWVVTNSNFSLVIAGVNEDIHSLRVTMLPLGGSPEFWNRFNSNLSSLFKSVYPNWPDAERWWVESAKQAWESHPLARKKPLANPEDVIIRKEVDGITSATFGVPPDIVVFTITARAQCVPKIDPNPLQRVIC